MPIDAGGYYSAELGEHNKKKIERKDAFKDYLMKNGMITNDLCVHYVSCHRDEICKNDKRKLKELIKSYKQNNLI